MQQNLMLYKPEYQDYDQTINDEFLKALVIRESPRQTTLKKQIKLLHKKEQEKVMKLT